MQCPICATLSALGNRTPKQSPIMLGFFLGVRFLDEELCVEHALELDTIDRNAIQGVLASAKPQEPGYVRSLTGREREKEPG